MNSVVTSIDALTGGVKIEWTEPEWLGSNIEAYEVEIADSLGSWYTELNDCDASSSQIISQKYCIIDMNTLVGSSFNLVYNDLVEVRVTAFNSLG
jgi:hypothetical protein